MVKLSATDAVPGQGDEPVFTILGGTTVPDRATIVRADCREGSQVELRRRDTGDVDSARIDVWLECRSRLGLFTTWKKIGYVPDETAAALLSMGDESSSVVARGTVRAVYAPVGREEAAVTVEIKPRKPG